MDVIQCQTALCHTIGCHRAVDAAGEHIQGTATGAHGQTTLTRYFRAVNIRTELEEILAAEAAMPGLAALEAEAAEQTERIRVRITDQVEFEG